MFRGHPRLAAGAFLSLAAAAAGCAGVTPSLPPPEEVLLVVNQADASLTVLRVDNPSDTTTVPLGGGAASPASVSARNGIALVPLGADPAVAVVDLRALQVTRTVPLPANSGATGAAIVDDSIAYVANPNRNTVTRVNYLTGDTASVAVGVYPQAVVFTRGRVFVLNGNVVGGVPVGASWVSVIDPVTNHLASGVDSIGLPGPGNAAYGDVALDGVLYVMNVGSAGPAGEGRLSLVDPVGRSELGNFTGFGPSPGAIASNGVDRLFVSSLAEGLMVFDLLNRRVERGAGSGVPIPDNSGVAVDAEGRIYALERGTCAAGNQGNVHILRQNLTTSRVIPVGACPAAAAVTEIPPVP